MKTPLIPTAVAAAIIPLAHAETALYGRVSNHIDINAAAADNPFTPGQEGGSPADVSGSGRFGVKFNGEIGPGLYTHLRYEFAATTDKEEPGVQDTRIATAGMSGLLGRVDIGNQWSAYYNTFGTLVSPTFSLGYFLYDSVGGGVYRASNTIKYSNDFGPVAFEFDARFNESGEDAAAAEELRGDGFGFGMRIKLSEKWRIAFAVDREQRPDGDPAVVGDLEATEFVPRKTTDAAAVIGHFPIGSVLNDDDTEREPTTESGNLGNLGGDLERFGIAAAATFGGMWFNFGWQSLQSDDLESIFTGVGEIDFNNDGDTEDPGEDGKLKNIPRPGTDRSTFYLYGGGNFTAKTKWLLGFAQSDDGVSGTISRELDTDNDGETDQLQLAIADFADSRQYIWGVYHDFGDGFRFYYEGAQFESDALFKDGMVHLLGMRVIF